MRKELPYFQIESSYGGNQNWFHDLFMKMGGCAAVTACDLCIDMALFQDKVHLYPYDSRRLNKEDYIQFSKKMKPYLRPRLEGIKTLKLYMGGYKRYIEDVGETELKLKACSGELLVEKAKAVIRKQIDKEIPIPYLLLKHKNKKLKNFTWHWFLIVGYEEIDNEFFVKVATYGEFHWLSLPVLWNTGYREKGGMIIVQPH